MSHVFVFRVAISQSVRPVWHGWLGLREGIDYVGILRTNYSPGNLSRPREPFLGVEGLLVPSQVA